MKLTREEVRGWPAMGPMNLDPRRVWELLDDVFESPEWRGMRPFHVLWALTAYSWRLLGARITSHPEPGTPSNASPAQPEPERHVCGKCWPVFMDFLLEQDWKRWKK